MQTNEEKMTGVRNLTIDRWDDLLRVVVDAGQPEGHVLASRRHHHVLWVELNAPDGLRVVTVQHAHFGAVLSVPDVNPAVSGSRNDELRVRGERRLQGDVLGVQVTGEGP